MALLQYNHDEILINFYPSTQRLPFAVAETNMSKAAKSSINLTHNDTGMRNKMNLSIRDERVLLDSKTNLVTNLQVDQHDGLKSYL
jgi:hypothetical protein